MTVHSRRGAVRISVVAFLISAVGLFGAGTALAHNSLNNSAPADGAAVATGPGTVTLTFNDIVQNLQPLITVVGPDADRWEGSPVSVVQDTVSVPVNPLGPAGLYTIAYRVISADGHAVEGTTTFTLTAAGSGTANPVDPTLSAHSDSIPAWVWIVGAIVVIAAVVAGGVITGRRRTAD